MQQGRRVWLLGRNCHRSRGFCLALLALALSCLFCNGALAVGAASPAVPYEASLVRVASVSTVARMPAIYLARWSVWLTDSLYNSAKVSGSSSAKTSSENNRFSREWTAPSRLRQAANVCLAYAKQRQDHHQRPGLEGVVGHDLGQGRGIWMVRLAPCTSKACVMNSLPCAASSCAVGPSTFIGAGAGI